MQLSGYFARIGFKGPATPDLKTLRAIHRAHLCAIAYENLDIHLGRALALDLPAVFDKLVTRGRGGWCFEMNGLLAWALREIGFQVSMLGAAVNPVSADMLPGRDHLVLRVDLDQPWLADAGFGNGFLEPIPLRAGRFTQLGLRHGLSRDGAYWTYHSDPLFDSRFVFSEQPLVWQDFAGRCHWLQTDPASWFTALTACFRARDNGTILALRGRMLSDYTRRGPARREIFELPDYASTLRRDFGLSLTDPELAVLWPRAQAMAPP